ncbi:hypothetical protein CFK37_11090 [Virgibacillus phasianinus]|uniref:DUF2252 domain-containing protein n=1 Tax=Virgibacillus phasianinus TaxID=2017483 RepID=A0A220U3M4_9BACI|nr:DUF2252 family protein [Virgibacillus phasianinus]ASK62655.1 hypothetical protein CFK37_11090 [Virgibacillus phasianinus]
MANEMMEHILLTRKKLRKETVETVLSQFDGELLDLNFENQRRKYKKMLANPFQFYRGSAFLFYYDATQVPFVYHTPDDKPTWLQGDLHFENFGAYKNKEGDIVYNTNDFDEGYLGSYLYDVYRMAVSIALYSEELGYSEEDQTNLLIVYLQAYYKQLVSFVDRDELPGSLTFQEYNTTGPVQKVLQGLPEREVNAVLDAVTTVESGERKFQETEGLKHLTGDEQQELENAWPEYIASLAPDNKQRDGFYRIKDVVKKLGAGTGSIGLLRYYILIDGHRDGDGGDLVLEAKEARTPAPNHFFPYDELFSDEVINQGKRVITAQKAMQYLEDPYLGYFSIGNHDFYVRENSPYDEAVDPNDLMEAENMESTVEVMGKVTAKAHARADEFHFDHESEEEIVKAIGPEYNGFISQLVTASLQYKKQVHEDYQIFTEWCAKRFDLQTK